MTDPVLLAADRTLDTNWWRQATVYQIYPRSFADSDGNGIGDIAGVTSRMDYLAELGVDAIWLSPFYPSALADGGYDVADYRDVAPELGTLDDFDAMVAAAHAAGIKVIVDIVPNHTSDLHPWFQEALAAEPGSAGAGPLHLPRRHRPGRAAAAVGLGLALRRPGLDPAAGRPVVLPPVRARAARPELGQPGGPRRLPATPCGSGPTAASTATGSTWRTHWPRTCPSRCAARRRCWPDVVDGSDPLFDRNEVHEIYAEWRQVFDTYDPPRTAVAEAFAPTAARRALYARPTGLGQAFNFDLLRADFGAAAYREVVTDCLDQALLAGSSSTWVLSNHDVVRHTSRFGLPDGADYGEWLMSDGRDPVLDEAKGLRRARAATLFMLALPGSAYLYQGEELGLHEVADLPAGALQDPIWLRTGNTLKGRDGCRVPLPWDARRRQLRVRVRRRLAAAAGRVRPAGRGHPERRPRLDPGALPAGAAAAPRAADRGGTGVGGHRLPRRAALRPAGRLALRHQLRHRAGRAARRHGARVQRPVGRRRPPRRDHRLADPRLTPPVSVAPC